MALVVEDGTGVATANAYDDISNFLLYWLDRNIDYSDFDAEVISAAIIDATGFIEGAYLGQWKGYVKTAEQALAWPRTDVVSVEGSPIAEMPTKLKRAMYELAAKSLNGTVLWPQPSRDPNLKREKKQVGPMIKEIEYDTGARLTTKPSYPAVEALLRDLLDQNKVGVSRTYR